MVLRVLPDVGNCESGFAMVALLISVFIVGLMLSLALPVWDHAARREREAELIFRGEQYTRAIMLFQRQRPGAFPSDVDTLVEQRFLRKKYRDPMTNDGDFRLLLQSEMAGMLNSEMLGVGLVAEDEKATVPTVQQRRMAGGTSSEIRIGSQTTNEEAGGVSGGIIGVVSKSSATSVALYNGRSRYNQWTFTYTSGGDASDTSGIPVIE